MSWKAGSGVQSGRGVFVINIPNVGVNRHSNVVASATEVAQPGSVPVLGDAGVTVQSVAGHDNGSVSVRVLVEWDSSVWIRATAVAP